jgi:hypothetical protein
LVFADWVLPTTILHPARQEAARLRTGLRNFTGDAMSNMGVFGWIRDSVRRSVLLGFSDAVEQLGVDNSADEPLHPQLASVLRDVGPKAIGFSASGGQPGGKSQRKRLGRSLDQLRKSSPPKNDD